MLWSSLIYPSNTARKAGGWLLIFAIIASLVGCIDVSCDGNDPAAVAARALSKARLERLYADAEDLAARHPEALMDYWDASEDPHPDRFNDIGPVSVRIDAYKYSSRPKSVGLMLKGCFDHYIYLKVLSIGDEHARIELQYGEPPNSGAEILWRRDGG